MIHASESLMQLCGMKEVDYRRPNKELQGSGRAIDSVICEASFTFCELGHHITLVVPT